MKDNFQRIFAAGSKLAKTAALCGVLSLGAGFVPAIATAQIRPLLPIASSTVSTIPSNGDVNPYGVAFLQPTFTAKGVLHPGDVLVSNFNNSLNIQGTGSTIVRIGANGQQSLFFQGPSGIGLSAALGVLQTGFVLVGSLPTTNNGTTLNPGSLFILDSNGHQLGQLINTSLVNGPWGMAIHDQGDHAQVFISNVLTGTIVRLDLTILAASNTIVLKDSVVVGTGFSHRPDPAALVLGPSGLFYNAATDVLYVASSADNAVYSISSAGTRTSAGSTTLIYQDFVHLHGPLDLIQAPNGDFIVANSDGSNVDPNQPSELVEFTPAGVFVGQSSVDANNGGAFGIGLLTVSQGNITLARLAAVDDNQNTLTIFTVQVN